MLNLGPPLGNARWVEKAINGSCDLVYQLTSCRRSRGDPRGGFAEPASAVLGKGVHQGAKRHRRRNGMSPPILTPRVDLKLPHGGDRTPQRDDRYNLLQRGQFGEVAPGGGRDRRSAHRS